MARRLKNSFHSYFTSNSLNYFNFWFYYIVSIIVNRACAESNYNCCACGTAKYQMTFSNYHTGDGMQWTDIIGATHNANYSLWKYDARVSAGIREFFSDGITGLIEKEINKETKNIRTFVKSTKHEWESDWGVKERRISRFSVDADHHLLSLITKLQGKNDIGTGVSLLNLCQSDCHWLKEVTFKLFLLVISNDIISYKAGSTDLSEEKSTNSVSRATKTSEVNNNNTASVGIINISDGLPVVLLRIQRQVLIVEDGTACNENRVKEEPSTVILNAEETFNSDATNRCFDWTKWSPCTHVCGQGVFKSRSRLYIEPSDENSFQVAHCPSQKTFVNKEKCICPGPDPNSCFMKDWSQWSECTCPRGQDYAIKKRYRSYKLIIDNEPDNKKEQEIDENFKEAVCEEEKELREEICWVDGKQLYSGCYRRGDNHLPEKCLLPVSKGRCMRRIEKWYFDELTRTCRQFNYSGCNGNRNRFNKLEQCESTCVRVKATLSPKMKITPLKSCRMKNWSDWSDCSGPCGRQERHRNSYKFNEDFKTCPIEISRRPCRIIECLTSVD